jgi:hypothetical protein
LGTGSVRVPPNTQTAKTGVTTKAAAAVSPSKPGAKATTTAKTAETSRLKKGIQIGTAVAMLVGGTALMGFAVTPLFSATASMLTKVTWGLLGATGAVVAGAGTFKLVPYVPQLNRFLGRDEPTAQDSVVAKNSQAPQNHVANEKAQTKQPTPGSAPLLSTGQIGPKNLINPWNSTPMRTHDLSTGRPLALKPEPSNVTSSESNVLDALGHRLTAPRTGQSAPAQLATAPQAP